MRVTCHGCDMPLGEWTYGCTACRERHRKRALRSGDPTRVADYHRRGRAHLAFRGQETSRQLRDGSFRYVGVVGRGGRWVKAA